MSARPNMGQGEYWKHCSSGICSQLEQYKGVGRKYIVRAYHSGIEREWCPTCVRIHRETHLFKDMFAVMIRTHYDLHKRKLKEEGNLDCLVALHLYVQDLLGDLGQEL